MDFRKLTAATASALIAGFALAPSAHATGDVWLEGSYERLNLADVNFVNDSLVTPIGTFDVREEFVNDNGMFNGFRFDGGIANIPVMGGAYVMGVRGFFAWHDDKTDLECGPNIPFGSSGTSCVAQPLVDDPTIFQGLTYAGGGIQQFTTERDVDHWGVAIDIAQGPNGLRAGPAFRQIDQDLKITGRQINPGAPPDPFQLTYSEDLETNYWGAFVAADGAIDLGGGWSLQGDAEAGLYWADTDFSGNYVVTNGVLLGATTNPNVSQSLSLDSNELAFIGVVKAALEKDFGAFKLAGFGRVEYISSAPDVAYNDLDTGPGGPPAQGPDDETRLGERYAYTISTGARVIVPLGAGQ